MNSHSFGSHKCKGEALNLENSFSFFSFEHSTKEYACEILGLRTNVFAVHDAEATDKKVLGDFWSKKSQYY